MGTDRPTAPDGLVEDLEEKIRRGTSQAVARWTEPSMAFGKSHLFTALDCDGKVVADRKSSFDPSAMNVPKATGILAHHAVQIAQTHPGHPPIHYVRQSVETHRRKDDNGFAPWWADLPMGDQSDVVEQAKSRVGGFLDSWPPLRDEWRWRFEEPVQATVGKLKLTSRMDLILGSAKNNGRQTMFLCDFKSGGLNDDRHPLEADFYALVSTLSHGVPPFRSTVYSLASGDWTDPDVTAEKLHAMADMVVRGVVTTVDMLTEAREPELTSGRHCRFCPALTTCPAAAEDPDVEVPVTVDEAA